MSLKQLTKSQLLKLAEGFELSEEGTKPILEERLAQYFDNHPELEEDEEYKKYIQFRKRSSPRKSTQTLDDAQTPSGGKIQPLNDKLNSSPNKVFSLSRRFRHNSSPAKGQEDDDSEEDSEEESEDDDEEGDVEVISSEKVNNSELLDDEDAAEAEPSASKFELVAKIQDWFSDKYSETTDFVQDTFEDSTDALFKQSAGLRKSLSSADSVNFLTSTAEGIFLLYEQVPVIQLKQVRFLDQAVLSKYSNYINPHWPVWDLSVFLEFKFLFVVITWFLLSIGFPLVGSYFFNFISKKTRKNRFDPFVFSLFKLLLAYTFLSGNVSFSDVKNNAEVWAQEHGILESTTFFHQLRAHLFHNSITLRLVLGNLPFIGGSIGALVSLYSAAI